MTQPFITNAFIAGELDRPFYSRTDLDKYALGVAKASNFTIDFRGGLKSRPGFRFWDYTFFPVRIFPFFTGEDTPPIVVFMFSQQIIFWSGDSFITDDFKIVSAVSGDTITVGNTVNLSPFDLCYVGQYPYALVIREITGLDLTVEMMDGTERPLTGVSVGSRVDIVKSLTNTYTPSDIENLTAHFRLDRIVFSCPGREVNELVFDGTDFTFGPVEFTPALSQPTGLAVSTFEISSTAGNASATPATGKSISVFSVSAVDAEGNVSLPSRPFRAREMFNYTRAAGNATITWNPVAGAVSYRVYRSIITENNNLNIGAKLGFIGESATPSFVDSNFIPDYTQPPSTFFNPFAEQSVLTTAVTAGGSGYNPNTATVSIAGGTGFIGYPIVEPALSGATPDETGPIKGILVYSGGSGYTTSSAVTFAVSGTGATGAVTAVSPATGLWPRVSTVFQQRRVYAGSPALPLSLLASQPGLETNFNAGNPPADSDAYTLSIDASEVVPIRHLIPVRSGMLVMLSKGVYRLFGRDDGAVTPNSFVIEPQAELSVGTPPPILINNDLLFSSARGTSFHSLAYTFYTNSFSPQEISILAPHLFGPGQEPVRIVYAQEPDKLVWVLRKDGTLLSLTYLKEQEIFAWAQHHHNGFIHDICDYSRNDRDSLMIIVEHRNTSPQRFTFEELEARKLSPIAEYWGVDSAFGRTYESPITQVTQLWHLEGKEVSVLADGSVLPRQTVTNGIVNLQEPATTVRIGLPYECLGISLPLSDLRITMDGRYRRIVGTAVRVLETRGLEIGTSLDKMYEMRDRGWEDFDEATRLRSDNTAVLHRARWERDAQVYFRQRYPLPAMVLGYVTEAEIER